MALINLTYISKESSTAPGELQKILLASRKNNAKDGITGALYFDDGYFLQCLEGEEAVVMQTYERIAQDPRHTELSIVDKREVPSHHFFRWNMAMITKEQAAALAEKHALPPLDIAHGNGADLHQFLLLAVGV